jgi:hypothetical protein
MSGVDFGGGADGRVAGEAVVVGERSGRELLPLIQPSPPFLLQHHPNQWNLIFEGDRPELLPVLSPLVVEPGVGNVDEFGDPSAAITDARRRGWIVLPQDACKASDTPDSKPGYVRRLRVRGGWLHHTPWASWRILAGRALPESDQKGYNAWLRRLMADGTITPPDPAVLERMLRDAETRLQRAQSRDTRSNAAAAALAERAGRQVDGLREVKDGGNADALEARRAYLRAELDRLSGGAGK